MPSAAWFPANSLRERLLVLALELVEVTVAFDATDAPEPALVAPSVQHARVEEMANGGFVPVDIDRRLSG